LAIKRTGYKIFTGLSYGRLKVLKGPEAQHKNEEHCQTQHPQNRCLRGRGMDHPLLQTTEEEQQMQKRKLLVPNVCQQIRGYLRRKPRLIKSKR
jgi:hypothetical protein